MRTAIRIAAPSLDSPMLRVPYDATELPERRPKGRGEAVSFVLAIATMLISTALAIAGMVAAASLLVSVFT